MEGGGGHMVANMGRRSSIESEPKTLSIDQIQCAREEALYVVKSRKIEEAMRIFLEGLKPVKSLAGQVGDDVAVAAAEWDGDCGAGWLEDRVQFPDGMRDIFSSPF